MIELLIIGLACLLLGVCVGLTIENLSAEKRIKAMRARYDARMERLVRVTKSTLPRINKEETQ